MLTDKTKHHILTFSESEKLPENLHRIRRHAIAILRFAESALGIPSSLRPEIGKEKDKRHG